jgi:hypothetical protein
LDAFEWSLLTAEVRERMPTVAFILLENVLPSVDEISQQYHRGRRRSTRRPLSPEEATLRLDQRIALIMGVIMATVYPRTHTLVQQLMSAWLWIGNATSSASWHHLT